MKLETETVRKSEDNNNNKLMSCFQNASPAAQQNRATAVPPQKKLGRFQVKPCHTL